MDEAQQKSKRNDREKEQSYNIGLQTSGRSQKMRPYQREQKGRKIKNERERENVRGRMLLKHRDQTWSGRPAALEHTFERETRHKRKDFVLWLRSVLVRLIQLRRGHDGFANE